MNENKFINNTMTNINTFKNNICNFIKNYLLSKLYNYFNF